MECLVRFIYGVNSEMGTLTYCSVDYVEDMFDEMLVRVGFWYPLCFVSGDWYKKNSFLISVSYPVLISSLRLFDVAVGRKSILEGLNHK